MSNNINDKNDCNSTEELRSRRAVLKMLAAAPLVGTFGLLPSPLMRYLKPTTKPLNVIQPADFAVVDPAPEFSVSDFPKIWSALPFMVSMKYRVFNPEQFEIRKIPGIMIRTGDDQFAAFSRKCPKGDHILYLVCPLASGSCGCGDKNCRGYCIGYAKTPFLHCSEDRSSYDISDAGRTACGNVSRPAREFGLKRDGNLISVTHLEWSGIA